MGNEWVRLTPAAVTDNDLALASFGDSSVVLRAGYEDGGELRGATDALPVLLTMDEHDALAAYAPKVKAREQQVQALVEYHRSQEWSGDRNEAFCLSCGHTPDKGHAEDCAYIAALASFAEASRE